MRRRESRRSWPRRRPRGPRPPPRGSTICASTRFWYPASRSALMITLESPVAPDDVASAASVKTTGPSMMPACAMARSSGDQLALHAEALRPELPASRSASRRARSSSPSVIDENLRAELRHVGERIADHDARGQRGSVALDALALPDQVAVAAGPGDQLVARAPAPESRPGRSRALCRPGAVRSRSWAARSPVSAKSTCG